MRQKFTYNVYNKKFRNQETLNALSIDFNSSVPTNSGHEEPAVISKVTPDDSTSIGIEWEVKLCEGE